MITREFSGKEETELLKTALDTLKLREDQVKIEYDNKNGIFPFGKKDISLKISFDEDLIFGNRCLMFVKELLERMDVEAKIYLIEESDERIVIEIESPDSAMIIGKQGKNLEAIQTLANVILNKNAKVWTKIVIDIGNYRYRKEKQLKNIAISAANEVKKTKKSILLEPMNPFERRIIHLTLKEEMNIETVSEGDGLIKSVKVLYDENK